MKVALCCIGAKENDYIVEYINHYKKLGFDNVLLFDNNKDDGEYFYDVIDKDDDFVKIINYRNRSVCQLDAYNHALKKYGKYYDWIAFFDCDEFLTLTKHTNIKDYLKNFENEICVHINWALFDDNNLIRYDNRPCEERFTHWVDNQFENDHIKSIVNTKYNVRWIFTTHTPVLIDSNNVIDLDATCVNNAGIRYYLRYAKDTVNYEYAYLKHFQCKTLEEFIKNKMFKGWADLEHEQNINVKEKLDYFFDRNIKTPEKLQYIKEVLNIDYE